MTGIVVIPAVLLYLLLSVVVVLLAVRYARKSGRSAKRWGWGVALVIYLIPFWNWLPTVATHQYYCAKDAGFWVYKTVDQWKAENPGVMETLVYKKDMPHIQTPHGRATVLNQRFLHIHKQEGPFPLNRWRIETEIRDVKKGESLRVRLISLHHKNSDKLVGRVGSFGWIANAAAL